MTARPSSFLIPFVLVCAVLADRAQIGIASGGRGMLPLLAIVAPMVAVVTVARYGSNRSLGFLAHPIFVFAVLPYLVLTALLPVLGVVLNGYPERTLLSITEVTTALSFLVIGAALSTSAGSWSHWILVAVALQLTYAAGQVVYLTGGPGSELFVPFHAWDISGQDLTTFVQGRSSGFYFNPNVLGFWAGAAAIVSWTMMSPGLRGIGVSLSLLTLLLSQSRGAATALFAAVTVGVVHWIVRGDRLSSKTMRTVATVAVACLFGVLAASALAPQGAISERFGALVSVLWEGPRADVNLAGRLDAWEAAIELNLRYPWGTLGSPELLLGTAIDSAWFRAFAQGSVLYVAALGLLIFGAFSVAASAYRGPLRLLAVLVAIAGTTQIPFGYPVIVLFWVVLGAGLQASVPERGSGPVRSPAVAGNGNRVAASRWSR